MSVGEAPPLLCQDERRRRLVRESDYNGLDYLEVSDDQRRLTVYFLGCAPEDLEIRNFEVRGGVRIRGIRVVEVKVCPQTDPERDNCVVVTVDRPGDFSTYRLCLVNLPEGTPYDPRYRCLDFSFKAACPSDFDCLSEDACPEEVVPAPDIDYLAKDYASFRQLLLDRMAVTMPDWTERHVPDIGITLVELFAYVGDYLSYYQDAVATEAYLWTARQRISVRRHARLVDYILHDGCNARAWIAVQTSVDRCFAAREIAFLTAFPGAPDVGQRLLTWNDLRNVPEHRFLVFEPLIEDPDGEIDLVEAHNEIRFYTWGDARCCLLRGATSATLIDPAPPPPREQPDDAGAGSSADTAPRDDAEVAPGKDKTSGPAEIGRRLRLAPGDVLIFLEIIGPDTGNPADADPARRHAVRLTRVAPTEDPLTGQPLLEIEWAEEDALPFPLCLSVIGPAPECKLIENVSVALGNVVLADHGRTKHVSGFAAVPVLAEEAACVSEGRPTDPVRRAGSVVHEPIDEALTQSVPVDLASPARGLLDQDPRAARPVISLIEQERGQLEPPLNWVAMKDLLASTRENPHFVVEVDDRQRPRLRFGNGREGRRPEADTVFDATFRTGNGPGGNVGADRITLAVVSEAIGGITLRPRNPLPADGGTAPEPVADVKRLAPHAFRRVRERAVVPTDYAELAERLPGVQRAAAEQVWQGSWYEIRVAIDPLGAAEADPALLRRVAAYLENYRRVAHDVAVRAARYVPLDIVLTVCVRPGHLPAHVRTALKAAFGTGCKPDGSPGFFNPDALTFGDNVAVSRLVAAAHAVPGVATASVTRLQRLGAGEAGELAVGVLKVGPLEIARLDADPNFPENGRIHFEMRGGA